MRRAFAVLTAAVLVFAGFSAPAHAAAPTYPPSFPLPNGWQPEGIAIGGPYAYFGSRADGSIYRADLRTGQGSVISKGPGTPSLGLKVDGRGRLFVSGGSGGDARVVDTRTGKVLASYRFVPAGTASFVNDVVLTVGPGACQNAAWFTDSTNPVLYKLPLGRHGALPAPDKVVRLPLSGAIKWVTPGTNANGIVTTPDGCGLMIVQSVTGKLFRVDPATGVTAEVDLGGYLLTNGDGLLRLGRTLYAVQNRLNKVAILRLEENGAKARLTGTRTNPAFDVPTTVAAFRNRLYLPNARFSTPPTPDTTYTVNSVRR
jgi:sugar lactone lactonase YvrE